MLLSPILRPAPLVLMVAMLSADFVFAGAQSAPPIANSTRNAGRLAVPPRPHRAGIRTDHEGPAPLSSCHGVVGCRAREASLVLASPPVVQDGRRETFALVGLVAGALAGWGWYAYQCSHGDDCYSPVGGVLLAAAGGAVGLLVGLLIAPAPRPR